MPFKCTTMEVKKCNCNKVPYKVSYYTFHDPTSMKQELFKSNISSHELSTVGRMRSTWNVFLLVFYFRRKGQGRKNTLGQVKEEKELHFRAKYRVKG